jgi:ADP-ribose pyrophosphatase YjhB (NUDIX family)
LEKNWQAFTSYFNVEIAAGGKVLNEQNNVLFIFRFGKWDLPKGKLEQNESLAECAVREVQEECGIQKIDLIDVLDTTYHIFKRDNTLFLKITHWFLMKTTFNGKLKPQLNEGIEKAMFKNEIEIEKALKNTYKNIKLLF